MPESSECAVPNIQYTPCDNCEKREACRIGAVDCMFKDLKECVTKEVTDSVGEDCKIKQAYKNGFIEGIKKYAYFKGGCAYVGHDKPRKLKDVLKEMDQDA